MENRGGVPPLQRDGDLLAVVAGPAAAGPGVLGVLGQLVLHDLLELRKEILQPRAPRAVHLERQREEV